MSRLKSPFRQSMLALPLGKRLAAVSSVLALLWLAIRWAVSLP